MTALSLFGLFAVTLMLVAYTFSNSAARGSCCCSRRHARWDRRTVSCNVPGRLESSKLYGQLLRFDDGETLQRLLGNTSRPALVRGGILEREGLELPAKSDVVHSDPDIMSGTPVFAGTRVPVQSLFDYLEAGETLDEFLRQFPSVSRKQAVGALALARDILTSTSSDTTGGAF